jgi:phage terminase large subunit-like protein
MSLGREGRDLLDALDTAMGKRAEPLMIVISTQAARDEAPLSTLIDYGLRIQRGEIADPSFHLTFYTAPEDADPWKQATWKLANPALGDFRSLADVKRLALQAQRMPAAEASFKNLILNMRCEATSQFLNMSVWKMGGGDEIDIASLQGRPCYAGLDLGATRDMSALVLVFAGEHGEFTTVPYCWLPGESLLEAQDRDHMPYGVWAHQGICSPSPAAAPIPRRSLSKLLSYMVAIRSARWRMIGGASKTSSANWTRSGVACRWCRSVRASRILAPLLIGWSA